MPSATYRIGLVGAGWVSRHHLAAYRELSDRVEVVAIADLNNILARERAAEFGIAATYSSLDEMLATERLDAVDIATPRETHIELCQTAGGFGIPILCQKPIAPTLREAERFRTDFDDHVPLMVHENWRFRPHYRTIADWLAAGRIGEVRTALMEVFSSGLVPDSDGHLPALVRQPMLVDLDRMLVMEIMIHHVDTLRFLLGPLTLLGSVLGKSCEAIRAEDRAALALETASGAAITLTGDLMVRGAPPSPRDHLRIFGVRGAITLCEDCLSLFSPEGEETVRIDLEADYRASYRDAIEHFLDQLASGSSFETGLEDNIETLRIIEAAYAGV